MEPGEMVQFPFQPVPTEMNVFGGMTGDGPVVILQFKTPDTLMTTFWQVSELREAIKKMVAVSDQVGSGLIIPQNGQGPAVDLSRFRDVDPE